MLASKITAARETHNIKETSSSWSHLKQTSRLSSAQERVGKTPRQGETPQLSSAGLSATSCHRRAMSQVYGAAVSIIATGLRDGAEPHLLAAIAGFAGGSAIKETCNTLTNGYTAVAKLTMTSLLCCLVRAIMCKVLSGSVLNVQDNLSIM